jgi:hypothetical protein
VCLPGLGGVWCGASWMMGADMLGLLVLLYGRIAVMLCGQVEVAAAKHCLRLKLCALVSVCVCCLQMTLSELRGELERRGLDLSGTKSSLELRLAQAMVVEIAGPQAAGMLGLTQDTDQVRRGGRGEQDTHRGEGGGGVSRTHIGEKGGGEA